MVPKGTATKPSKPAHKFRPDEADKHKWLQDMGIGTVLDIGAHKGESAREFHEMFPEAMVYSFEPLGDCFELLESKFGDHPLQRSFNIALGDEDGETVIHRSEFAPSSSLRKMADNHKEEFPFTSEGYEEKITTRTLDGMADEIEIKGKVFMKVDVQGFEDAVLRGAEQFLSKVDIMIVEMSFRELYEGQPQFPQIYDWVIGKGFEYKGSWHQLISPQNGAILQQNAIFLKR